MPAEQSSPVVNYRPIPGYPGYQAGDDGSIWSNRRGGDWRRLKGAVKRKKQNLYVFVSLKAPDGKSRHRFVHRIILEVFVGPCPEGMQSCHSPNPDGRDNRLCNLRWDTPLENSRDTERAGRRPKGEQKTQAKLTDDVARDILRLRAEGWTYPRIQSRHPISRASIWRIVSRRGWLHID